MEDPGLKNRRITLRTTERTSDGGGGYTETAVDLVQTWAHVEPLQGNEQIQAMQTGMKIPHRFTIRYRPGLTGATEILYGARRFDIQSIVDPDEEHEDLEVLADEILQ